MKEAGFDLLEQAGVLKPVVNQRKRKREINKNNKKIIDALQDDKVLSFEQECIPRNRQSRSQTILLAQRYGGDKFQKSTNFLSKHRRADSTENKTHQTLISAIRDEKIKEEDMPKVEVHNNDKAAQDYLVSKNLQPRPDLKPEK